MNAAGATASFFPIAIFQVLDWGISVRRQSVVFPIPRRTRNYSNFEINSHLALEIASTTTSQIAKRLYYNSTSRRSFVRSVIADYRHSSFFLLPYSLSLSFFIYEWIYLSNHVRIVPTDDHVVRNFPMIRTIEFSQFLRPRQSENSDGWRIRSFQIAFDQSSSIVNDRHWISLSISFILFSSPNKLHFAAFRFLSMILTSWE